MLIIGASMFGMYLCGVGGVWLTGNHLSKDRIQPTWTVEQVENPPNNVLDVMDTESEAVQDELCTLSYEIYESKVQLVDEEVGRTWTFLKTDGVLRERDVSFFEQIGVDKLSGDDITVRMTKAEDGTIPQYARLSDCGEWYITPYP